MSYTRKTVATSTRPNFLASEVGLITKSVNIPDTGVTADSDGLKIVKAGTVWPANDATATGIIFDDVDVTNGTHAGSLIVAGRVFGNRLHTTPIAAAITALKANGLYIDSEKETERVVD